MRGVCGLPQNAYTISEKHQQRVNGVERLAPDPPPE
jgi:hypothetical protein